MPNPKHAIDAMGKVRYTVFGQTDWVSHLDSQEIAKQSLDNPHVLSQMKQGDFPIIKQPSQVMLTFKEQLAHRLSQVSDLSLSKCIQIKPHSRNEILSEIQKHELRLNSVALGYFSEVFKEQIIGNSTIYYE